MEVGRSCTSEKTTVAVKQGPHTSSLALYEIEKIHKETEENVQQVLAEVVYWDEIEGRLGSA